MIWNATTTPPTGVATSFAYAFSSGSGYSASSTQNQFAITGAPVQFSNVDAPAVSSTFFDYLAAWFQGC